MIMRSRTTLARIGGFLYLIVAVLGGFAESVRLTARVPGDAAATATNVAAHAAVFRLAFVADLSDFTCFLLVGLIMYAIFEPVDRWLAVAMLACNAVSVPIQALNMLTHLGALLIATDPGYTAGLSPQTAHALVLLLLDLQHQGYLIAQIFFGLWLVPLGCLVSRSGWFPRPIGVIVVFSGGAYVADVVVTYLSPGFQSSLSLPLGLVAGLGELSFVLWLLVMGARAGSARPASPGPGLSA
jgi:hypothetical protein